MAMIWIGWGEHSNVVEWTLNLHLEVVHGWEVGRSESPRAASLKGLVRLQQLCLPKHSGLLILFEKSFIERYVETFIE